MEEIVDVRELGKRSREFRIGNIIYLNGNLVIARDQAHKRLSEKNVFIEDIAELPIYHCGPIAKFDGKKFVFFAAGPTTSIRMEKFIGSIMLKYHTPAFIGKGGFGNVGKGSLKKFGGFYCDLTGGASAYAVTRIDGVNKIFFKDLGSSEALWVVSVKNFGPLLITQDSEGNDLRSEIHRKALDNVDKILKEHGL